MNALPLWPSPINPSSHDGPSRRYLRPIKERIHPERSEQPHRPALASSLQTYNNITGKACLLHLQELSPGLSVSLVSSWLPEGRLPCVQTWLRPRCCFVRWRCCRVGRPSPHGPLRRGGPVATSPRGDLHTRVSRMEKMTLSELERELRTKEIMAAISEMVNSGCPSSRDYQGWVDFGRRSAERTE
uniref:Gastrin/cholecystokinin peptide hormone domain-containing protein n=1 Tax=Gadus morhua TaxID=8049 RepID=A0A8C5C5Z5_GADMO